MNYDHFLTWLQHVRWHDAAIAGAYLVLTIVHAAAAVLG